MREEGLLLTIAEISIGFAGFAGIVALFGRRAAGEWSTVDRLRFNSLVGAALASLFAALLPLAFYYVASDQLSPWRLSSALFGACLLLGCRNGIRRTLEAKASEDSEANILGGWILSGLLGLVSVPLFLNALGIVFQGNGAPYLFALFLTLSIAGFFFSRLLRFA
jgi:hypothetical protein